MIEFLRALTGMAALDAVVGTLQSEVERLAKSSPRLAALLTRGEEEGFPHIDKELDVFRCETSTPALAIGRRSSRRTNSNQPRPWPA
jgi:hypothetical protein